MPSPRSGAYRNYLCPRYSQCLSRAARDDARTLPCASCPSRNEKVSSETLLSDLPGVLLLLMALFSRESPQFLALWEEHRRGLAEECLAMNHLGASGK